MSRWLPCLLALAGAGCSAADPPVDAVVRCPFGDSSTPAQLEIVHLDASFAITTTTPDARVPLLPGPQGGWIVVLGARAINLDGCRVDITSSFREVPQGAILAVDRRPTQLEDTGDGWAITRTTDVSNLQFCSQPTAMRDLHDVPYEITVTLEDAYGQRASRAMQIDPVCPDPDPTGRCLCECTKGYVVGDPCP